MSVFKFTPFSILKTFKELITTPIDTYRHWGIIFVIALMFIFIPQVHPPNDWQRNTAGLSLGIHIYQNPSNVYPPWALLLLWPYYFMTAAGSRVASVLVIGWLSAQQRWTLLHFGVIIASPFFLWTMVISNMDVLTLLFPILLWEYSEGKSWQALAKSFSLVVLLIKPQGSFLLVLYFIWRYRHNLSVLIIPFFVAFLVIIPVSLIGKPPLAFQWLNNAILNPSEENLRFWSINNVSLTDHLGFFPGVITVACVMGCVCILMQLFRKPWTRNHTYSSIFLLSMLLGPYASNQSMVVPLAFLPSWTSFAAQYIFSFTLSYFGIYQEYSAWWALLFGVAALWFFQPHQNGLGINS